MHNDKKVVIGVGGNIGVGKTTVCKIFENLGGHYISADKIGWEVLPKIRNALVKKFGAEIMDNNRIDKKKLRDIVFAIRESLDFLNNISHPHIVREILRRIRKIKSGVVIIDAALLFDWPEVYEAVDYPILITAERVTKEQRAKKKGYDKMIFEQILDVQKKESKMSTQAKIVIKNNGTIKELKKQCRIIFKRIKNDC